MRLYYFCFIFLLVLAKAQAQEQQTIIYLDSLNQPSNAEDYYYKIEIGKFDKNANAFETTKFKKNGVVFQKGWSLDEKEWKKTHHYFTFFSDGKLRAKVTCVNGKDIGPVQTWYINEQKKYEGTNLHGDDGKTIFKIENYWKEDGTQIISNGNGLYDNIIDGIKITGEYKDGFRDGTWTFDNLKSKEKRIKKYENKSFVSGTYIDAKGKSKDFQKEGFKPPVPPGGKEEFMIFLRDQLVKFIPNKNFKDLVIQCYVEKDGSLSNIEVLKSNDRELNEEIKRILRISGKWTPAEFEGKITRYKLSSR